MTKGSIVVLDFGGQYTHLIARRVREAGAHSVIMPAETSASDLTDVSGIILSGGPSSVYEPDSPQGDPNMFHLQVPVLGICYGLQWMVQTLGGSVRSVSSKEYGRTQVHLNRMGNSLILMDCDYQFTVWMSHGDEAEILPDGFRSLAHSATCQYAAIANDQHQWFGLQFHPEVRHTNFGSKMLRRFVELCDAPAWSIKDYAQKIGEEIRQTVGDQSVFMLVSGGVDSLVAFTLLNLTLGKSRVRGLLIDNGLMRENEIDNVQKAVAALGINNLMVVDAKQEFLRALANITEPEQKRKIIGDMFVAVQENVGRKYGLDINRGWLIGQGTIYPDTIETGGTKNAATIKTHHNRSPDMQAKIERGLVIEPLKGLYKDEVRSLGVNLGLPQELIWRHPFPGPGLGVRLLCANNPCPIINLILDIPVRHLVLPVRSVGVQGDERSYKQAVVLFSQTPVYVPEEHWQLATTVPNTFGTINRVVHCLSHRDSPKLVFTPTTIDSDMLKILREADALVSEELHRAAAYDSVWQFPVVMLPFGTTGGGHSIVLRPIKSDEAMTAEAARLSPSLLQSLTDQLLGITGVDMVFYDLTSKPPGTIEWE